MKIIVMYDYGYINGGAASVAINSALDLEKSGNDVTYLCSVGPISPILIKSNVKTICLNENSIDNKSSIFKKVICNLDNKAVAKKIELILTQYDSTNTIIHIHGFVRSFSSSIFPVIYRKNFKFVYTIHDYFLVCPNGGVYNYKKKDICHLKPSSFRCFCCNCDKRNYENKIYRDIRQIIQNHRTKKIKNIISISNNNEILVKQRFKKANYFRLYNSTKTNVLVDDFTKNNLYLFVGRLSEEKNCELFCQAMKVLKLKGIVIGDGPLFIDLKKKFPNIYFTGWLESKEIDKYKCKTKCLIITSKWYEGLPLTAGEFLLSRVPVICSDVCNAKELFLSNHLIFESQNIESLCRKILIIEKCTKKEFYDDNYNFIDLNNIFSKKEYPNKLLSIYKKIMND